MKEKISTYTKLSNRQDKRLYALKICLKSKWRHLLEFEKISEFTIDVIFYDYFNVKAKQKQRQYNPNFKDERIL